MPVITQDGNSALMMAVWEGKTDGALSQLVWILQTVIWQFRDTIFTHFILHSNITYIKSKLKRDKVPMLVHQHTASQDQTVFNKMTIMINGTKNPVRYYCNLRDRSLVDAIRRLNFHNSD